MSESAPEATPTPEPTAPPQADPPADPPKDSTDWKSEARKWEERAKANKSAADKLAEIEAANKTELEKAQEAAQRNADLLQATRLTAVEALVKANASGFVNTQVPFAYIDKAKYVTDDGSIDETAIKADLAALLTEHPELAQPAGRRAPAPNPAQGSSASGSPDIDTEIAAATKAGNHLLAIQLKQRKQAALKS